MEETVKLVVFVPAGHEEAVRLALGDAGAGRIGDYDHCAFVTRGTGHYRPLDGATPYQGRVGTVESADECRLETVCATDRLPAVLRRLREVHPYEEIAFDVMPMLNHRVAHMVPPKKPG